MVWFLFITKSRLIKDSGYFMRTARERHSSAHCSWWSCSSSWIAHRLFVRTLVLLYLFARSVVEHWQSQVFSISNYFDNMALGKSKTWPPALESNSSRVYWKESRPRDLKVHIAAKYSHIRTRMVSFILDASCFLLMHSAVPTRQ